MNEKEEQTWLDECVIVKKSLLNVLRLNLQVPEYTSPVDEKKFLKKPQNPTHPQIVER